MREQRLARIGGVPAECGADGEPLVGRHVLRRARAAPLRAAPGAAGRGRRRDARRHLDDVVVGEPRERAVVPDVDLVHLAGRRRERRDEPGRRLAVEGAAALLQQRRLLVDLGIAVDLEQLLLDLGDGGRARHSVELLVQHARRARRSSAGSTTGSLRAPRAAGAAAPTSAASSSPRSASSCGSTSSPATRTARIHVRWLRPT